MANGSLPKYPEVIMTVTIASYEDDGAQYTLVYPDGRRVLLSDGEDNYRRLADIIDAEYAKREPMTEEQALVYAFGHLVASHNPEDPHHADSGDLAREVLNDRLLLTLGEVKVIEALAEHVAGNWKWTGEAQELERRIERGEV